LADVAVEETEWLWPGRIPLGEITILEGDPATNKSSLTYGLTACVTQGRSMPCMPPSRGRPCKRGALFLIGEDSVSKTVKRRLLAAGADVERIGILHDVMIPGDLGRIERAIREINAKLMVVDTINDFVSCHTLSNQGVRKAFGPLRQVAERTRCAVVMLRHFNKKSGGRSLHRGGGSVAITGVARSQLKLYLHPNDQYLRVLVQDKCNLGPLAPNLLFEIVPADCNQFRLECRGETPLSLAELEGGRPAGSKLAAAQQFLLTHLADGEKEANWLFDQARDICSQRTLNEAKRSLGVVTLRRNRGRSHRVYWSLATA
jgi:hypothetical protein